MKQLLLLETIFTGLVFVLLLLAVDCKSITKRFERALSRAEKRPIVCIVGIVLIALALRVSFLFFFPTPQPQIHDEFSYLLAADTFASGRLSNPTHPLWQFFESFHVNQIPTYASMYPPAQGMILAAGRLIGGNAWLGVLVSTALMCGGLCWMLQGWLPGRWALLGGAIAMIRIAFFSYWGNSYWGGTVAAIGGLLVLGAIPRLVRHDASVVHFFWLGFGIVILANSRPYEGLLLCIAVALAALVLYRGSKIPLARLFTAKWLVTVFALLIGFSAMGFYYSRVTGSPLLMAYKVNEGQYAMAHAFLWQRSSTNIEYRHEVMKNFYTGYYLESLRAHTLRGFFALSAEKISKTWLFFVGPVLSFSLLATTRIIFDRRIRFLLLTAAFATPGLIAETWFHVHYIAPFTGIFYVFVLNGLRHLRFSRALAPRIRYALFLTVPTVLIMMVGVAVLTFPPQVQGRDFGIWCCNPNGPSDRSRLMNQLQTLGGKHLVFVEYTSDHDANADNEWVYNPADIDSSPVVFARHMDETKDLQLMRYYPDREVWRLVVAHRPLRLDRYRRN